MNLVFVYGSLKKGFNNHPLLERSECVGRGLVHDAQLYSLGSFPALVIGEGSVEGEVYEADEETMKRLDMLEGHPHFYQRQTFLIDMHGMHGQLPCHVYVFQGDVSRREHIPMGEWTHEHIRKQTHALRHQSKEAV